MPGNTDLFAPSRPARVSRRSALIALALCAGMLIASAPAAQAATTTAESKMASYINNTRQAAGRKPLRLVSSVNDIARSHSKTMAATGSIFHSNLGYKLRNYNWSVCGENVGMGPSIYGLHKAFMASAPHRANILYRGYERMGIGMVYKNGSYFVTVMFLDYA